MISPHAVIYLFAYMVPALVGFVALILYTHLLSPAEYGIYVIGSSIAAIVSAVFFAWVRQSVLRYQASFPKLDFRAEAIVAYGGTAALIACLTPIAVLIIRPGVGFGFLAGSIFLSLSYTAFEISQEFSRAQLNPLRFAAVSLTRSTLGLALGYFAIELGFGGLGLLIGIGASFLLANVLSFPRSADKPLRLSSADHLAQFVRYGLPFSLGALAFSLHSVLDRLGVAYLLGPSGAGYYGLTADMTRQLTGVLATSVAAVMFPMAFRSLAETGPVAARERLKEGLELLLALIAPVTVWLAISADVVTGTLLGTEFQASVAALLPLLALGRMCGAVNQFYLQVSFQLGERPLLQVAHDVLILGLNITLLFVLTLAFGLLGTAAAVLIAEALGIMIGIGLSRRAFKLPLNGRGILRVLAATSVMAAVTYAAKAASAGHGPLTLLCVLAGGGVAYAGAVLLFDVAGVRTSVASFLWPRSVPAE
ncbi:MAG: oligosaccharide flippase family protein [Xanthobacteraceae bacterium]|nr:oligosaccharide flippase family protein [Xanthobacteraceae bacterium]